MEPASKLGELTMSDDEDTCTFLYSDEPIAIPRTLVRVLGDYDAAALVQQVRYRSNPGFGEEHDGHRWATFTNEEWSADTLIAPDRLKALWRRLVALGVIERRAFRAATWDRTRSTRVVWARLRELVADLAEPVPPGPSKGGEPHSPNGEELHHSRGGDVHRSSITRSSEEELQETTSRANDENPLFEAPALTLVAQPVAVVSDGFAEFWAAYPRKVKKPDALKAWRQIPARDRAQVMLGLAAWVAHWAARGEPQYTPYPATWLRARQWEDQPDPPARSRNGIG